VADEWKQKFTRTAQYKKNVHEPLIGLRDLVKTDVPKKSSLGLSNSFRQWIMLSRRYLEVLSRDKLNLLILFAQASIIAFLTFLVVGENQTRDFVYFILSLVAVVLRNRRCSTRDH
jgi:hypothetical protein